MTEFSPADSLRPATKSFRVTTNTGAFLLSSQPVSEYITRSGGRKCASHSMTLRNCDERHSRLQLTAPHRLRKVSKKPRGVLTVDQLIDPRMYRQIEFCARGFTPWHASVFGGRSGRRAGNHGSRRPSPLSADIAGWTYLARWRRRRM